jgi:hypothetical protein
MIYILIGCPVSGRVISSPKALFFELPGRPATDKERFSSPVELYKK